MSFGRGWMRFLTIGRMNRQPEEGRRGRFAIANLVWAHRALYLASLSGVLAVCVAVGASAAASEAGSEANSDSLSGRYIVVLKDSVNRPGVVAQAQTERRGGNLRTVFRQVLNGYAATLPKDEVEALRSDPQVAYVTPDHKVGIFEEEVELETENNEGVEVLEATVPTGLNRTFAATNKALAIDGKDNLRADVDVAVLDTGIDYEHPDLDVEARTNCVTGTCVDNTGKDGHSHGTHVAGTIGAIDNGEGVVGVAPGARMYAVKVLDDSGFGYESQIIAGVKWVTAHAKEIEVANVSLGCICSMPALDTAINSSVEAGVVYAVAAGNNKVDAKSFSPANNPNVITVSALADYDGKAGAKGSPTCANHGLDDRLASFSNYGTTVEIVAPGVCILSTIPGNKYGYKSGTSMASPHVAGAAALLAAISNPGSKKDAEAIRETLVKAGNKGWTDTSGDGVQEPLLDVSNEAIFRLVPSPPTYSSSFGTWGTGNGQFLAPADVEIDASTGDIWVADRANNRLQKFNSKGEYLSKVGSLGSGNGQFKSPAGVTIDLKGNLWVADSGNVRLQKFNSKGEFLLKCGSQGSGNGQFSIWGPKGIAVDSGNNIWVTDSSGRVQKFNEACEYLKSVGSSGTGAGQFVESSGIDIGAGKIWVGDWSNDRVSVFSEAGEYLSKFGTEGSGNGQFKEVEGVEIDSQGNVWVLDGGNDRVQQFNQAGEYQTQFGSSGSGAGQFDIAPAANLASDDKGALWVADNVNHRIQKWLVPNYTPTYSSSFGTWGTGNGQFLAPADVEIDASTGDIWVADRANNRLQKFNSKGEYLSKVGSLGSGNGQFKSPAGVTIDLKGNLWVADSGNVRLQKFNSKGEFLLKCGSQGSGNGQFSIWGPKGIAVDSGNNIWVTDSSGRVQKFNEACEYLKSVGSSGTGAGQFVESSGIDIGAGKIWVGDWSNDRVSVFSEAGEYLSKFGTEGSGNGQFKEVEGVEIDSQGNVWVLDGGNDRVQQFNQAGEYQTQFGSSGSGAGQFDIAPAANLASDDKGALWVADNVNHRIQKWLVPGF